MVAALNPASFGIGMLGVARATGLLLLILLASTISVLLLQYYVPVSEVQALGLTSVVSHIPQALGALIIYRRMWSPKTLGQRTSLNQSLEGLLMGVGLGVLSGFVSPLEPLPSVDVLLVAIVAIRQFIVTATPEEMLFRGFYLRALSEATSARFAVALSSLAFGLFHFTNLLAGRTFPEVSVQVIIGTLTGLLFGLLYVRGGLAPPVLCHWARNFFLIVVRLAFRSI